MLFETDASDINETASVDDISSPLSFGKNLDDIFSIDLALCVLAIASIDYLGEDKSLVINEIVRMAKRYSTDKSYAFVNGLISSIYRE